METEEFGQSVTAIFSKELIWQLISNYSLGLIVGSISIIGIVLLVTIILTMLKTRWKKVISCIEVIMIAPMVGGTLFLIFNLLFKMDSVTKTFELSMLVAGIVIAACILYFAFSWFIKKSVARENNFWGIIFLFISGPVFLVIAWAL